MSGRVLRFEGSVHNQAMRLLPWYVNGTLLAEEFDLVCQHVAGCSECRREVDDLRRLQDICARVESPTDATASFARLKRRLQHDHAGPASRWDRLRSHWMQAPTWFRVTLATQSCVLFAVAGVLIGQQYSAVRSVEPASLYRTLGDTVPGERSTSASDVRLVVMFDPRISHAEMQRLLRLSRARIIDGPNDAGAYVLAVPANGEKAALNALHGEPGVALVQSLDRDEGKR
jgi:hypothetical protein